jgi:hypothetical protein
MGAVSLDASSTACLDACINPHACASQVLLCKTKLLFCAAHTVKNVNFPRAVRMAESAAHLRGYSQGVAVLEDRLIVSSKLRVAEAPPSVCAAKIVSMVPWC